MISSLLIGLTVAAVAGRLLSVWADAPSVDPRSGRVLPFPLRLLRPWAHAMAPYAKPRLPATVTARTVDKLLRAGLDRDLAASEFLCLRLMLASTLGLGGLLLDRFAGTGVVPLALIGASGGAFWPGWWLDGVIRKREQVFVRALPACLDLVAVAVEAGLNLTGALRKAFEHSAHGPLRDEIGRVLRDVRAGRPRADALRRLAQRVPTPGVQNLVAGIVQAEATGANLGDLLRIQADRLRQARFERAERLAMEAPVKLLMPLLAFIFPNFFVVIAFLIVSKAVQEGVVDSPLFARLLAS